MSTSQAEVEQLTYFAVSQDEPQNSSNDSSDVAHEPPWDNFKPLFFADSEDENDAGEAIPRSPSVQYGLFDHHAMDHLDDVSVPPLRDSSVASVYTASLPKSSSPAESVKSEERPTKKRRLSSASDVTFDEFAPLYIGSFIVPDAWSTKGGTGYVKSGDEINIERDQQEQDEPSKSNSAQKRSKGKGKTKQLSISAMLKPQASKTAKKKEDYIVRLTNKSGYGI